MKDITTALLTTLLVLISLISLISADPMPGGSVWGSLNTPGNTAELELRYALRR